MDVRVEVTSTVDELSALTKDAKIRKIVGGDYC